MMLNMIDKQHRTALVFLCTFLATACTGPLVVGSLYNGAADRAAKQAKNYADFTNKQQSEIDNNLAAYHNWHRHTQLPDYGSFILTIANDLEKETTTSLRTVTAWLAQVDLFANELRRCSPLNSSAEFFKQLSDKQVQQIAAHIDQKRKERTEEYNLDTETKRQEKRRKNIIKWIQRAGLEVNEQQAALLTQTLAQQINLQEQQQFLWQQWSDGFIGILEKRNRQDFTNRLNVQISSMRDLTRTEYPGQWQFNTELWTSYIQQYLSLQTPAQRQLLIKKAKKFANTVNKISTKNNSAIAPRCYDASL